MVFKKYFAKRTIFIMELDYNGLNKITTDMKNNIDIEILTNQVNHDLTEKENKKLLNLIKRTENLNSYSQKHDKTLVERIPVLPASYKQEVVTASSKCRWTGKITQETKEITVKAITDDEIIQSIKTIRPDDISESIFWFDNGGFYFVTDKGKPYNFRKSPRGLNKEETEKVNQIIKDIEESRGLMTESLLNARVLSTMDKPEAIRSKEEKEFLKENEAIMNYLLLEMTLEESRGVNYESFKNKVYGDAEIKKRQHSELLNEGLDEIHDIYSNCEEDIEYFIHPMKENKQVKIYCSKSVKWVYERLGYKVYRQVKEHNSKRYKEDNGSIVLHESSYEKESYYFQMNLKAFISSCKFGKVVRKGFYLDDNGFEVELTAGKTRKGFILLDMAGNELEFKSMADAGKKLDCSKMAISKAMKDKSNGDKITIKGNQYFIQ